MAVNLFTTCITRCVTDCGQGQAVYLNDQFSTPDQQFALADRVTCKSAQLRTANVSVHVRLANGIVWVCGRGEKEDNPRCSRKTPE